MSVILKSFIILRNSVVLVRSYRAIEFTQQVVVEAGVPRSSFSANSQLKPDFNRE